MHDWFVQGLGIIGALIGIARMQMPDRKRILLYHSYLCVPFLFHYLFLGGIVATIQCFVGFFRTYLLAQDRHWENRHKIALICVALSTIAAIPFMNSLLSWLTLGSLYVGVIGEIQKNPLILRICLLGGAALWMAFALLLGSYGASIICGLSLISNTIGIYRHHIRPALNNKVAATRAAKA